MHQELHYLVFVFVKSIRHIILNFYPLIQVQRDWKLNKMRIEFFHSSLFWYRTAHLYAGVGKCELHPSPPSIKRFIKGPGGLIYSPRSSQIPLLPDEAQWE